MSIASADTLAAELTTQPRRYLLSPWFDFLGLGGLSFIVLPLVALIFSQSEDRPAVLAAGLFIANFINHPHFAHSYQIFYRGFLRKAFGQVLTPLMRLRFIFAGLIAPFLLLCASAVFIWSGRPELLGYGVNIMAFLVGWHYAKQGYGMAIVDSVLKRQFFNDREKRALLLAAYSAWLLAWISTNRQSNLNSYWGLPYATFALPAWSYTAAVVVAAATNLWAWLQVFMKWRRDGRLPWNGLVGYVAALYPWLIFVYINPLFLLVVPAFHSLQYLTVVWRYQWNRESDKPNAGRVVMSVPGGWAVKLMTLRFAGFTVIGLILGYAGFWGIPAVLDRVVPYDREAFGGSLFFFIFWIFINVHHYFIDNVMWRRENPETKKYLFA